MNIFKKKPSEYFLIGFANKNIGRNPPTLRRLLQNCLFYREQNNTIEKSVTLAIKNAMFVWGSMGIEIKRPDSCERKLKREFAEWKELIKNKKYKSARLDQKRDAFKKKLDIEFDIRSEPKSDTQSSEPNLYRTESLESFEFHGAGAEASNESDGNNRYLAFHVQY